MVASIEKDMVAEKPAANRQADLAGTRRKEASWWNTIFWMLKMILLFNLVAGLVAYFVWFR